MHTIKYLLSMQVLFAHSSTLWKPRKCPPWIGLIQRIAVKYAKILFRPILYDVNKVKKEFKKTSGTLPPLSGSYVVIRWSRLAGMKLCPVLPGSRQCYKSGINYILPLHVKSFIPRRRDSSFVLPGSRFPKTKFSHVIAYISIHRNYFYYIFTTHMTSTCETDLFIKFHRFVNIFKSMGIYGLF